MKYYISILKIRNIPYMKKYSIVVHPAELLNEITKIKQHLKAMIG